jgi:hypothetical protein
MAKKKAKKKTKKGSARKSLKLRRKPLRDLPAGKNSTKVKGGATLTQSQLSAVQTQLPAVQTPLPTAQQTSFAPPYVPVQPGLQDPRLP